MRKEKKKNLMNYDIYRTGKKRKEKEIISVDSR